MNFFRLALLMIFSVFITSCGEENATSTVVKSATIEIDLGETQRVKVNDALNIDAVKVENDANVSSYLWKY